MSSSSYYNDYQLRSKVSSSNLFGIIDNKQTSPTSNVNRNPKRRVTLKQKDSSPQKKRDERRKKISKNQRKSKEDRIAKARNIWEPIKNVRNEHESLRGMKQYVAATHVSNYLLKDPVLDYYKEFVDGNLKRLNIATEDNVLRHEIDLKIVKMIENKKPINSTFLGTLFEMGRKFEDEVMLEIRKRFPNCVVKADTRSGAKDVELTQKCMEQGIPFIEQAAMYDHECKIYGYADLLVRSDYISTLVKAPPTINSTLKAPYLKGDYHYVVIDIKWSTMELCSDGVHLRNSERMPANKGQLAIYTWILGKMQGYTPATAYIMAKSWKYTSCGVQHKGYNCFDRFGVINYEDFDESYVQKTANAIQWIRRMRTEGEHYSCVPPSCPELYPNMANKKDAPYSELKKIHAEAIKELTLLWYVGAKNRFEGHNNGVFRYDDPNCCSANLGINGGKIAPILDKMIHLNNASNKTIEPNIIKNNMQNWQKKQTAEFFVDFETLNTIFVDKKINLTDSRSISDFIFMIGVGYEENNVFKYKSFIANTVSLNEEIRIVTEFFNFIETYTTRYSKSTVPKLFHWSHAEVSMMNHFFERHQNMFRNQSVTWIDFLKVFKDEPIVIRGVFGFGLKEIAKKMCSLGYIQTEWDDDIKDGMEAALQACEYYRFMKHNNTNSIEMLRYKKIMDDIERYNSVDCRTLWEIITFFRKHTAKNEN